MGPAVSRPESGSLSTDLGKPEDCHEEQLQTPARPMCPHTPSTRIAACLHHSVRPVPVPVPADSPNPTFPGRSSSQCHKVPTHPTVSKTDCSELTHSADVSEHLRRARRCSEGGGYSSGKGRPRLEGPAHTHKDLRAPRAASRALTSSTAEWEGAEWWAVGGVRRASLRRTWPGRK